MRRQDKALQQADIEQILHNGEYGVFSTVDEQGQPYGVPLNYVYMNDSIYFHCALDGHKLDNIRTNSRVSFNVVGRTRIVPEKFSCEFESVILFGHAAEISGEERYAALKGLIEKYSPDFIDEGDAYIHKFDSRTGVVKISIDSWTGKGNVEG